jgi:DeoR/GlpR family transcriptional regulator of sugar metabolism
MQAEERLFRIREYVQREEFVSLEELARVVRASISTVRRDLAILEAEGILRRTYGGARLLAEPRSDEFLFTARDRHEPVEKEAIGRACAKLIGQSQSLILDAGTTVFHVARHLEAKRPQIITNSLPVAGLYISSTQVEMVVVGGAVYPRLGALLGPAAIRTFRELHADIAIMGAGGITDKGVTNSPALLIDVQHAMMKAASRVIFCLDHTKLGRFSLAFLCNLSDVDTVITDSKAGKDQVDAIRSAGPEVIIAG